MRPSVLAVFLPPYVLALSPGNGPIKMGPESSTIENVMKDTAISSVPRAQNASESLLIPISSSRSSAGGGSSCTPGLVQVKTTATNVKITYDTPSDQEAATEFVVELLQASSDLTTKVNGDPRNISGTYTIFATLCMPRNAAKARAVKTVQLLSHGDTLSSNYWDIAPNASYVDYMTEAGYAVFSYDRLGLGRSEHPDPIQVVQFPMHIEVLHVLGQMLRRGQIGGRSFSTVIGVGHSAGSTVTQALTARYPTDFDAIILTGLSALQAYIPITTAALNFQIGVVDQSVEEISQKSNILSNSYLEPANAQGIQFSFYKYPNFDPTVFQAQVKDKQTNTIGELLTYDMIVQPSPAFTGSIDVVLGKNDMVFCGGNCSAPNDQAAAVKPAFFENASGASSHYLVPGTGHVINAHKGASLSWDHMLGFMRENGVYQ